MFERIGFAVTYAVRFCVMILQQNVNNIRDMYDGGQMIFFRTCEKCDT